MKLFSINDKKGYFNLGDTTEEKEISEISAEDLIKLIEFIIDEENNVEEFEYNDDDLLVDDAPNKLVFKKIVDITNELIKNKETLLEKINKEVDELNSNLDEKPND